MEKIYTEGYLRGFVESVFQKMGFEKVSAGRATDVLLSADLKGIDSHGVARLSGYVKQWQMGRLLPEAKLEVIHEKLSTATVDAGKGLGLLMAQEAMKIAIEKAKIAGTAWVAVQNSGHFGIAGYHSLLAIPHDMIGIAMTNASALVAPTFSREAMLGTNPIAMAIPTLHQPTFVADLATTAVAYGKLQILQRKNMEAPLGWVQDKEGNPSTNPHSPKEGGALLPLGGTREGGSHKGYALAAMVDILTGVLSGANFGPWVPPFATAGSTSERTPAVGKGTGHFFGVLSIDAFQDAQVFKERMDFWIESFRAAKAIEGYEVLIPGDPERIMETYRKKDGIPMIDAVQKDLGNLAEMLKLDFE